MMTTYMFCFLAGWALGSLSLYSYIVLSARPEVVPGMELEEDDDLRMAA